MVCVSHKCLSPGNPMPICPPPGGWSGSPRPIGVSRPLQVTILNGSDIRSFYNFSGEQVRTLTTQLGLIPAKSQPQPNKLSPTSQAPWSL